MDIPYTSINALNDDCLLHVLELLNLPDRLTAEKVCQRWRVLSSLLWKKFCSFDVTDEQFGIDFSCEETISEDMSSQVYKEVFLKCFSYLTSINLSGSPSFGSGTSFLYVGHCSCDALDFPLFHDEQDFGKESLLDIFEGLLLNCKNIEELSLCHCILDVDDEFLRKLFDVNKKLRSLVLSKYSLYGDCLFELPEDIIESIVLCECKMNLKYLNVVSIGSPKLHTLRLHNIHDTNEDDDGIRIHPISPDSLLRLSVEDSVEKYECVFDIYRLKSLTILRLKSVDLEDGQLKGIARNCVQLKMLDVSGNGELTDTGLSYVDSLPQLICLGIGSNDNFTDSGLESLHGDLKELDISSTLFTSKKILSVIKKMPNLEQLDVSSLNGIDKNFVKSAIDIVESRPNGISLTIVVEETNINNADESNNPWSKLKVTVNSYGMDPEMYD